MYSAAQSPYLDVRRTVCEWPAIREKLLQSHSKIFIQHGRRELYFFFLLQILGFTIVYVNGPSPGAYSGFQVKGSEVKVRGLGNGSPEAEAFLYNESMRITGNLHPLGSGLRNIIF